MEEKNEVLKELNVVMCPKCNKICRKSDNDYVYCNDCETEFCFVCRQDHFEYDTPCDKVKLEIDELTNIIGSDDVKACPICRIIINKDSGCNCVKCKNCKLNFVGIV